MSETPQSGPATCGEDALFSFAMCSDEFESADVSCVNHGVWRSYGIAVNTMSSCVFERLYATVWLLSFVSWRCAEELYSLTERFSSRALLFVRLLHKFTAGTLPHCKSTLSFWMNNTLLCHSLVLCVSHFPGVYNFITHTDIQWTAFWGLLIGPSKNPGAWYFWSSDPRTHPANFNAPTN